MPQIEKINGEKEALRTICLPVRDMVLNDKVDRRVSQAISGLGGKTFNWLSLCVRQKSVCWWHFNVAKLSPHETEICWFLR